MSRPDDDPAGPHDAPHARRRPFGRRLAAIAGGALVVRLLAALLFDDRTRVGGDAVWYLGVAQLIPRGEGFAEPLGLAVHHVRVESAAHPPLYPIFLSVIDALGTESILVHRLWSCVPGMLTVVVVGLVARELAGDRAGLLAAGAGAVSIALVAQDVLLWSEGLFALTIACVVLTAYRYVQVPSVARAVWLTVAITASALTRAESALLYPTLLLPLVVRAPVPVRARLRAGAAAVIVAAVLLAPWLVYNAGRFRDPVLLSNGLGGLLVSSNCDVTYSGPAMGGWGGGCAGPRLPDTAGLDESQFDRVFRDVGLRYAEHHAAELAEVIPVRVLRTFGFWRPVHLAEDDLGLRDAGLGVVAIVEALQYWLSLVLGIVGLRRLVRAHRPVLPLVAPVVTVVVVSVVGYGTLRFRIALDVVLAILVGVALGAGGRTRVTSAADNAGEPERESPRAERPRGRRRSNLPGISQAHEPPG